MTDDQKKKIIVDDDWKSQVEADREAVREKELTGEDESPPQPQEGMGELPPATFEMLISTLATQIMASLGQIPDPMTNQPTVQLDLAQHLIDMLAMIEEKTKGNLTEQEAEMMKTVLHQLRMAFVAIRDQMGAAESP
jgi:hypothetical protein